MKSASKSPKPKTVKLTHQGKQIVLREVRNKVSHDCSYELNCRTYIGKVKLNDQDKTAVRIFLSNLGKAHTVNCEHDFDCCGQIYHTGRAFRLSRNRIKLRISEYANI